MSGRLILVFALLLLIVAFGPLVDHLAKVILPYLAVISLAAIMCRYFYNRRNW